MGILEVLIGIIAVLTMNLLQFAIKAFRDRNIAVFLWFFIPSVFSICVIALLIFQT